MISLRAVSTSSYLYSIGAGAVGAASLVYLLKRHFGGGVCRSKTLLTGKTAIITGANTGIGLETAVDLARRGARVLLACRSVERGERAAVEVRKRSGNQDVSFVHLDLSSLDSVRATAESILESEARIDILVNNAGVFTASTNNSEDGYEPSFAVNHLGHFLLTNLLLDRIKASPAGRIVNVSSQGYKYCSEIDLDSLGSSTSLSTSARYNRSKLANVLFTRSLARKLQGSNVVVTVVHPGVTRTEIAREYNPLLVRLLFSLSYLFTKSSWQGAQTSIHCAVSEEMVAGVSGEFFVDCKVRKLKNPLALDEGLASRLWQASARMVGLQDKEKEEEEEVVG